MPATLAIRMTRFFMKFVGFWCWNDRRSKLIMDLATAYTIIAILVAWLITGTDLWYSRQNFYQGAYAACNAMTVVLILLKLVVFTIHREAFIDMVQFSQKHFWQRSYDAYGQSVMRKCEARCVYFVGAFTFFAQCTVCTYTMHPIIENVGKNETDRILPFNIWLDFPITSTPYYEIMFFIETLSLIHSGICFFCFDNLLCIMIVHAAGHFRILQRRMELMFDTKGLGESFSSLQKLKLNCDYNEFSTSLSNELSQRNEFKNWVRNHQTLIGFVEMVERVYTVVILGQVLLSSLLICLVSYQAALTEDGSFARRMIFIVHSAGTFTQLFMFTLTCDDLVRQSETIADAVYHARWHESCFRNPARQNLLKDLKFVIMRARRPCCLTAGGFFPISLGTFGTILRKSISYLTLLRQRQESLSSL